MSSELAECVSVFCRRLRSVGNFTRQTADTTQRSIVAFVCTCRDASSRGVAVGHVFYVVLQFLVAMYRDACAADEFVEASMNHLPGDLADLRDMHQGWIFSSGELAEARRIACIDVGSPLIERCREVDAELRRRIPQYDSICFVGCDLVLRHLLHEVQLPWAGPERLAWKRHMRWSPCCSCSLYHVRLTTAVDTLECRICRNAFCWGHLRSEYLLQWTLVPICFSCQRRIVAYNVENICTLMFREIWEQNLIPPLAVLTEAVDMAESVVGSVPMRQRVVNAVHRQFKFCVENTDFVRFTIEYGRSRCRLRVRRYQILWRLISKRFGIFDSQTWEVYLHGAQVDPEDTLASLSVVDDDVVRVVDTEAGNDFLESPSRPWPPYSLLH